MHREWDGAGLVGLCVKNRDRNGNSSVVSQELTLNKQVAWLCLEPKLCVQLQRTLYKWGASKERVAGDRCQQALFGRAPEWKDPAHGIWIMCWLATDKLFGTCQNGKYMGEGYPPFSHDVTDWDQGTGESVACHSSNLFWTGTKILKTF